MANILKTSKMYPNIDMIKTGVKIKWYIDNSGMSIKDIQECLCLSCPQPIYRWTKGKILPSVDHLFVLSELFGVHMEDLLVKRQIDVVSEIVGTNDLYSEKRVGGYYKKFLEIVA